MRGHAVIAWKNIVYLQLTVFPWLLHVYRKDAIEPTQSTAECRNNHARWVRDIDFSPTPNASFVNFQHHYFVFDTVRTFVQLLFKVLFS